MVKKTDEKGSACIPHSRPTLNYQSIEQQLGRVVRTAQIGMGQEVFQFENEFASYLNMPPGAAVGSGTAALHLTLLAMDIGPGDEVIIPGFVCTALLNAVNYSGAQAVLSDIDPQTYNPDPADVKKKITRKTKAVIVPHMFGAVANLHDLLELNIPLIEDCAQSLGATFHGQQAGTFGHAAVFSFYATKVITTAEGGMVISHSKELIDRIKDLREYDHKNDYEVRYNYKMTDIHAALGRTQLAELETFISRRRAIAHRYDRAFQSLGLRLPCSDTGHIYFRYVIGLNTDVDDWIQKLKKRKVGCEKPVYRPLHDYLKVEPLPVTQRAWRESISIPIYPTLSKEEMQYVIDSFLGVSKEMMDERHLQ